MNYKNTNKENLHNEYNQMGGGVKTKSDKAFGVLVNIFPVITNVSEVIQTTASSVKNTGLPRLRLAKTKAFTLSEVLITLVIIGVIAAITVPIVHANSQEKALKSSLKKNYSVLKQFFERYYFRNGERFIPVGITENYYLKTILKKDLNIMADCGFAGGGYYPCFGDTMTNVYKTYNGKASISWALFDDGHLVLTDGSYIMLENGTGSPNWYISVDVNGPGKKPNRLGKDLFMFQIMSDGVLKPMGAEGTSYPYETYCSNSSSSNLNGAGCTVKVLGQY